MSPHKMKPSTYYPVLKQSIGSQNVDQPIHPATLKLLAIIYTLYRVARLHHVRETPQSTTQCSTKKLYQVHYRVESYIPICNTQKRLICNLNINRL